MHRQIEILTLGCRVNLYESVAIAEALRKEGFRVKETAEGGRGPDTGPADYYIVNTCSVTAESQRQSGQTVRRCAANGKTAVLGCASQNDADKFLAIPNVFYVGGCSDKMNVVNAVLADESGKETKNRMAVSPMEKAPYEPMAVSGGVKLFSSCRAFVKIQDGCSARCAYCIIPALRGPSRSRPLEDLMAEAGRLAEAGYRELIFTGISVSSYNASPLHELIRRAGQLKEKGIERVRFGSLSPGSITGSFLESAHASPNFMPHVHLSLQSGSDRILQLMNRPYTAHDAMEKVRLLKEAIPDIELSADFITGFPTETEEDYLETEAFVREADLLHVHAFPYSERAGTIAAGMKGSLPKPVRKERCLRLNALSEDLRAGRMEKRVGTTVTMLTEKQEGPLLSGHSEAYMDCRVFCPAGPGPESRVGQLISFTVRKQDGKYLYGEEK